jgi:membrane protein required for colicin V production
VPGIETTAFNWLDWALLIFLAVSVISGMTRGLVRQALGFASLFVGLFLAERWAPSVSVWLNSTFNLSKSLQAFLIPIFGNYDLEPVALGVISFLVVWGAVSIAFNLLGGVLQTVARLPLLATANRLGGAALGALKGAVVVVIVASLISFLPATSSLGATADNSYVVNQVHHVSPSFYQHLQELMNRIIQSSLSRP